MRQQNHDITTFSENRRKISSHRGPLEPMQEVSSSLQDQMDDATEESAIVPSTFTLVQYTPETLVHHSFTDVYEALGALKSFTGVSYLSVCGLQDMKALQAVCQHLQVNSLVLEDILDTGQHPKFEEHANYSFALLKEYVLGEDVGSVQSNRHSFILKQNVLVSFKAHESRLPKWVEYRLKNPEGVVRGSASAYPMFHLLMYDIIDTYLSTLEQLGDQLEQLEARVLDNPEDSLLRVLYNCRRTILSMRRGIFPVREVVNRFTKSVEMALNQQAREYFQDLADHTYVAIELVDYYRDTVTGIIELYMNSVSNRMNEIMKVLTVMSSIFIPLTFIAGIYGMNFEYMPLLHNHYSYFAVLFGMAVLFISMFTFFRRRKWI